MGRKPFISGNYWFRVDGFDVRVAADRMEVVGRDTPLMFMFLIRKDGKYKKGEQYGFALTREQVLALIKKAICLLSLEECVAEADKEAGLDAECIVAYKDCIHNHEAFMEHVKQILGGGE